MPVVGSQGDADRPLSQNGSPEGVSKEQRRAERRAQYSSLTNPQARDGLNAISVLGLGKMMPLGNIGVRLIEEQVKQTRLLEEHSVLMERQNALLERLVERMGPGEDGGHI